MARYKLTLEYDGRPFVGWQHQAEGISVQDTIAEAVFRFCGERRTIYGAGRTDAGVHALGQVAHVDIDKETTAFRLLEAVNFHLKPHPVAILDCAAAAPDFHARFSAIERRYLFRILNRRSPPALEQGRVWHVKKPLDAAAMHEAAQALVGQHDFTTFRDAQCQANSPVKTLDVADVRREGEAVLLTFVARSFLHRQVRSMTGSLAEVGAGRWTAADFKAALEARDRKACGPVAPPDGLYLTGVGY